MYEVITGKVIVKTTGTVKGTGRFGLSLPND